MRLFRRCFLLSGFCLLSLFSVLSFAESEAPPSIELLEFLGGWETEEGESVDPVRLLESQALTDPVVSTESEDDE